MKKSEIIAHFNARAEEAKSVKDLDALYFDVVYSSLDNYIVNTYKYLINLKYENMLLKSWIYKKCKIIKLIEWLDKLKISGKIKI